MDRDSGLLAVFRATLVPEQKGAVQAVLRGEATDRPAGKVFPLETVTGKSRPDATLQAASMGYSVTPHPRLSSGVMAGMEINVFNRGISDVKYGLSM
jgi:hypothetical protein